MLGRKHAGKHRVVAAFDARHVHEARRAADQRAARKRELRHRLPAAFGDGARAVANPLAAGEGLAHQRMRLEALEFLERRQIGILVVKVDDEADRHQVVAEMIEKRTAAGAVAERPTHGVLHEAGAEFVRRDLPQLLQADAEFLRLPVLMQARSARSAFWKGCRARPRRTKCIWRAAPCRGQNSPCGARLCRRPCRRWQCRRPRHSRTAPRWRQSPDRFRHRALRPSAPDSGRRRRARR